MTQVSDQQAGVSTSRSRQFDAVELEILWQSLISTVNEQARALQRAAFSPIVREAGDLANAVFDRRGRMVAQAVTGTPGHINSLAIGAANILAEYPIDTLDPGDVLITNDPYKTAGQLLDVTVLVPAWRNGRVIALFGSTIHHTDVGGYGIGAGGRDCFEEGLWIPICKLMTSGQRNPDVWKFILSNVRQPDHMAGDLHAQMASGEIGAQRLTALCNQHGLDDIEGHGSVTDDGNVKVGGNFDGTEIKATTVILATGSVKKPLPGTQFGGRVIGTEEAWALEQLPKTLAVVGAGASGTEIASAYARLGSDVTLYEGLDRVLPTEDADISKIAERGFKKQGITVRTGVFVQDVQTGADGVTCTVEGEPQSAEWLVIAAGRAPDVEGLGLQEAGIALASNGLVEVDGALRTSLAGVYAIGDLVAGPALAHKASDEGIIAVEDAAGLETHPLEHIDIPRATFCHPNVASFGLTEQQARDAGHDVVVGKLGFGAVGAGTVYGDRTGLVKIVGDRTYGELLGGHIIGTKATELIQELVNVRTLEGGYAEVARMVHGHPTLSEAVMEAARDADGWLIHG
jgi:dihydrolipoamide dehydrogenase